MTAFLSRSPMKWLVTVAQPLTHMVRRIRHPDVSPNHAITTAEHRGRRFAILHRRWSKSDKLAIQQCFHEKQYELPEGVHHAVVKENYERIVASGAKPLIVDCGANIGASVLWFAANYPEAHIVAIEPAAENFALLQHNCRVLDVEARNAGLAKDDGFAFVVERGSEMSFQTSSTEDGQRVEMLSLATVLKSKLENGYVPFLLKIDIEGGESELFDGDCSSFDKFPVIVLEPHDWMARGLVSSRGFFRFHSAGYRAFNMHHENVISIAQVQA